MRFKSWVDNSIWEKLFKLIADEPDMESVMIDATIVRAHACSAGYKKDSQDQECLGRSKVGFTTKIHGKHSPPSETPFKWGFLGVGIYYNQQQYADLR